VKIAHQKSFEKALHPIHPNFPQGKSLGVPEITNYPTDIEAARDRLQSGACQDTEGDPVGPAGLVRGKSR
jgi:hypothetical protein